MVNIKNDKNKNKPFIIAHRGNSSEAPENTLAAMKQALELRVDFVEIDVRLSSDHIPVIIHDATLTRNANIRHSPPIHQLPFSKIQQIDVGSKFGHQFAGEKIPTLRDLLHLKWNDTGLMIEIKESSQSPAEIVDAVMATIKATHSPLPQLVIGSFSLEIFEETKRRMHELKCDVDLIGIAEHVHCIEPFVMAGAKRVALWHKLITPTLAQALKGQEVDIWSFTIDDLNLANSLVSMGVSGIISNVPRLMLKGFHSKSSVDLQAEL